MKHIDETTQLPYSKLADIDTTVYRSWGITIEDILGSWVNIYEPSKIVRRIVLEREADQVYATMYGIGKDGTLMNWGRAPLEIYYDSLNSEVIEGAYVRYDMGFMENFACINIKKGVLVLGHFSKFKDDSKRHNYFNREFFVKEA